MLQPKILACPDLIHVSAKAKLPKIVMKSANTRHPKSPISTPSLTEIKLVPFSKPSKPFSILNNWHNLQSIQ